MILTLPDLPYAYNALEPAIDETTMHVHHDLHHGGYVKSLAELIAQNQVIDTDRSIEVLLSDLSAIPENIRGKFQNFGGGHVNHSFFWTVMRPLKQDNKPEGSVLEALSATFGDFDTFRDQFSARAMARFGSGWAWLVADKQGALSLIDTANQDSPISLGLTPLLAVDVWEHAYYLKYQNRRADYLKAWWNVINWDMVEHNLLVQKG